MSSHISDEDRRAVDLILDRDRQGQEGQRSYVTPGDVNPQRVESLEKILAILQHCPASEPPPDLAAKTLRKIERAVATHPTPPPSPDNRPVV